jgi:hypothetical protein
MYETLPYRRIINCTNTTHVRNLGKYLDKIRHKWENKVREVKTGNEILEERNIETDIV